MCQECPDGKGIPPRAPRSLSWRATCRVPRVEAKTSPSPKGRTSQRHHRGGRSCGSRRDGALAEAHDGGRSSGVMLSGNWMSTMRPHRHAIQWPYIMTISPNVPSCAAAEVRVPQWSAFHHRGGRPGGVRTRRHQGPGSPACLHAGIVDLDRGLHALKDTPRSQDSQQLDQAEKSHNAQRAHRCQPVVVHQERHGVERHHRDEVDRKPAQQAVTLPGKAPRA